MIVEKEPLVYIRGQLVPWSEAHIKIYDAAVVLGATVTDMTRTISHRPFRLEDHVARFYRSAKYARIPPPLSPEETIERTLELVEHNTGLISAEQDLGIIYFMSPGHMATYAGRPDAPMESTFCIHSFVIPFQLMADHVTKGVHVVTPPTRHVPPQCVDQKIKNRSRLHWWIADREARLVDPDAITLLLDLDGNVTECSGSNFFIVRDGKIVLPSPRNILPGVSMLTVTELATDLGIPVEARDYQVYDIINADEAMISTTPYCLLPATRINGLEIGNGKPGPVFEQLIEAWSKLVGRDLVEQITTVRFPE